MGYLGMFLFSLFSISFNRQSGKPSWTSNIGHSPHQAFALSCIFEFFYAQDYHMMCTKWDIYASSKLYHLFLFFTSLHMFWPLVTVNDLCGQIDLMINFSGLYGGVLKKTHHQIYFWKKYKETDFNGEISIVFL